MRSSTGRTRGVASREGAILGAFSSVTGAMVRRLKIARCAPVHNILAKPARKGNWTHPGACDETERGRDWPALRFNLRRCWRPLSAADPVETRCCPASSPTCRQGCRSSCRRGRRRRSSRSSWTTTTRARSRAGRSARRLSPCWSRSTRSSPSQVRPRPSRGPLAAATNAAPTPSINAVASAPSAPPPPSALFPRLRLVPADFFFHSPRFAGLETRRGLSRKLNVSARQVQVWFQNKRQRERKLSRAKGLPLDSRATRHACGRGGACQARSLRSDGPLKAG